MKLLTLDLKPSISKMLETYRAHIAIAGNLNAMGLRSKTVNAVNKQSQLPQSHPQQQKKSSYPENQHACRNCTKAHAPCRDSCPAKDSTCQSCGWISHWDVRCQSPFGKQNDPIKKPLRCGPKGTKQKQTHTVDVGDDCNQQCNEIHVITIDVHPHHSAQLGQKPRDDYAMHSALSPWVAQNTCLAMIVPPISMPYPAPSDPEHINITAINIDSLTKAWEIVTMPAEIGPNHCGSLQCKVNTGASGNVMPFHIFAKFFPRCITTDCKPIRLHPCDSTLTVYNVSNIPQFGVLHTATEWTPKGNQYPKCLQTRWYVADSRGPAILGLPSSSKLGIVQVNCTVKLTSRYDPPNPPKKPKPEHAKRRHDLTSPLNSGKDLIKAYPNQFEGIGQLSGTYHITLCDDAKPMVHVPRKCPITMLPLVFKKLDEFIDQSITVTGEEPTDWVSSFAYSWKANGKLWVCLDPKDINTAIRHDHCKTPTVEEITNELAGSTCFTKLHGTLSYLCIVLDYESSLLMTFNTQWGRFRFVCLPWGLACAQDIFQWMMDQSCTYCNGVICIGDNVVVHGKDDKEHDKCLQKFMRVTHEHGLVFNKDMCAVKQTSIVYFGCVYDATGAHHDPEKVSAGHKMLVPKTATQLQKFLRLVTYLSPFIPSLSSFTAPLHGLLKKGTEFAWNNSLSESIWQSQINGLQGYHTAVLWHPQACHCPGWCILKRCCPSSRWLPSCLCFQSCYTCGAALCQHRMWTDCLCLWSRMIPHLCLWLCLCYWEWP